MDNRRRLLLGCASALATASLLPAWAYSGDAHKPGAPGAAPPKPARSQLGTAAAIDPMGRLWVAYPEPAAHDGIGPAPSNIVLSWTADEGESWTRAGQVLARPEAVEANGEGRPKLAFGPNGAIYLSFTRPLDKPHTGYIRFVRSLDGGQTFSAPLTIQRDLAVTGHRFDSMLVDREGRIFIAWIDKRDADRARAEQRAYRGAAVYYAVSSDGGLSFGPDVRLAEHCCECCRIALAMGPGGEVVAMWRHIFAPNVRDHAMAVLSPARRAQDFARASFDDWRIDACPHHGPSLALDSKGARHLVWFSGAQRGAGLFYAVATSAGRPGQPMRLGGAGAEHGEVLASGSSLAIVWKEFDGASTKIMTRAMTGASAWQDRTLASSNGASDHPHLVGSGSGIWMVWRTEDEGIVVRKVPT